ncbi:TetR family transcriptional regulator [Humibacillus xanthopallidus]|uniref:TetR family transcriptional regulator n=1 Tax=Humibacillus xanthopallidus TaxID=412689 RepID=A0A543PSG8_9MICO|nr:TetR family transcriptional regulator C-terminal domain-containing protein [Humibacillus xanthopallidus]TQN47005.1 TetR family transcriptional regulator [Humibacillus xanthopallidus]
MSSDTRGPRDRMVYATAQHLRRAGVSGTGLRQVVIDADAPRGSLQHYFPGGKDQLVAEALDWAGTWAAARVGEHLSRMRRPTPSRLFTAVVDDWAADLDAREFARGCPVAAAVVDCADTNETVRRAADTALETWRRPLAEALVDMGRSRRRADSLSTLMLCALEGAILMARARRDTAPLRLVARELAPVLDAPPGAQR